MTSGKSNLVRPVLIRALLDQVAAELTASETDPVLAEQAADLRRQVTRAFAAKAAGPDAHDALIERLSQLEPPEVIRHAEQLIRERFSPVSPLYQVWGPIADDLNEASHLPDRTDWGSPRNIARFNRANRLAWAVIGQFCERQSEDEGG